MLYAICGIWWGGCVFWRLRIMTCLLSTRNFSGSERSLPEECWWPLRFVRGLKFIGLALERFNLRFGGTQWFDIQPEALYERVLSFLLWLIVRSKWSSCRIFGSIHRNNQCLWASKCGSGVNPDNTELLIIEGKTYPYFFPRGWRGGDLYYQLRQIILGYTHRDGDTHSHCRLLDMVVRSVCKCITGAIRMTPTEVLLEMLAIHIKQMCMLHLDFLL